MRYLLPILVLLAACSSRQAIEHARPIGTPAALPALRGLPAVPIPPGNPPTADTIALGRELFHDRRLSRDNTIACATCHDVAAAFADPRRFSVGVEGKTGNRNAPPVMNAAFYPVQFWDGRATSLEEQAGGPIANPVEMNLSHEEAVARVQLDAGYRTRFEKAFGPGPVTMDKITKAIASFERTLVSGDSPFDRFFYGHDHRAMPAAAVRGFEVFRNPQRGNCATCHLVGKESALFTDGKFHNVGAGLDAQGEIVDQGRFTVTKVEAHRGAFRTPTLRNIAHTPPYMHDGSLKTLKDVVDFYVGGGSSNPHLDKEIRPLKLNGTDRADLAAFLEALSGTSAPEMALTTEPR